MDDWFSVIAAGSELPASAVRELDAVGFVVVPGPVAPPQLSRLAAVYDAAVSAADPADVGSGRTTTRVWDFVNRAPDFDGLYVYRPILEACCRVISAPFHLGHGACTSGEPRRTRAGTPRGLPAHDRWVADGRLRLHGGRVSARQRLHSLCARFAPVAPCAERRDARCDGGLRGTGIAVRSRRLSRHLQRFRVARTWGKPDEGAAALDSGRLHPPRRQTGDEQSGSDSPRYARTYRSPCQICLEHRAPLPIPDVRV